MARPDTWFRFYNAVVDNPKVQRLTDGLFKVWVNLLCIASRNGGKLPAVSDVAFTLRAKETTVQGWLSALVEKRLIDRDEEGAYAPHDWDDLQFQSDGSKDRQKKYRDRKTKRHGDGESDGQSDGAVTPKVTAQEKTRAEQSKEEPPKPPRGPVELPTEFIKFWEAYPDKVGQKAAFKAWKNAKDKPELPMLMAALDRYIRSKPSDRAWCNPATWLNQGRWNDAPATQGAQAPAESPTEDLRWKLRIEGWLRAKIWNQDQWGPPPDNANCRAPSIYLPPKQRTAEDYLSAG